MQNKSQHVIAAENYAKQHNITVHQAFQDGRFQYLWNYLTEHPRSKQTRQRLGLEDKVKMSRQDYNQFVLLREFGETP